MGKNEREIIKQFETMRSEIMGKITGLKEQKRIIDKDLFGLENSLKSLEQKITNLQNSDLIVSEHAIIRYIERVIGINIEEIVEKISTMGFSKKLSIERLLGGKVKVCEGKFSLVKKEKILIDLSINKQPLLTNNPTSELS